MFGTAVSQEGKRRNKEEQKDGEAGTKICKEDKRKRNIVVKMEGKNRENPNEEKKKTKEVKK
jgi:hypothetical protein